MAEFLSQDEIDELLDIAEQGESINLDFENIKTVKYDIDSKTFYKHNKGYETEDEAKFRAVKAKLNSYETDIADLKESIQEQTKLLNDFQINKNELIQEYSETLIQFAEEFL